MRTATAAAGAVLLLTLAGCSAHVPPPSYTDAELEVYFENRLDAAWVNTGLEGQVERPSFEGTAAERFNPDNYFALSDCVTATGMESWQWGEQDGGPFFREGSGDQLPPDLQLATFECFAEYPVTDNFRNLLLTPEQKEYLYDYYKGWVVPCLIVRHYTIDATLVPDEAAFVGGSGDWYPYWAIVHGPDFSRQTGLSDIRLAELERECGGQFADLDVELDGMFATAG